MTAKTPKDAWIKADELMPCDYMYSVERSARAGYDIYYSTAEGELAEALEIIDDAIYQIDDKISAKLSERVGIAEARNKLYAAYAEIAKILKEQHPESKLIKRYNLQDA